MPGYNFNDKKIDIFVDGNYKYSTHAKKCREAKARFCEQFKIPPDRVKVNFSKKT